MPAPAGSATAVPPPRTPKKGTVGGWGAAPEGTSKEMPGEATDTVEFTSFEPARTGG